MCENQFCIKKMLIRENYLNRISTRERKARSQVNSENFRRAKRKTKLIQNKMPSMKAILLLSAIMMTVYFVDNCAGNPYPSIGNQNGKSKRLGNCAFLFIIFVIREKTFHV